MNQDSPGYQKLLAAVERDEKDGRSNHVDHRAKLAWVIDRAEHYAEKTGVTPEHVLDAWENSRDYVNYYQDSKQPLIEGDNIRVFEDADAAMASFEGKAFRCPACEGESKNPYECNSGVLVAGLKGVKAPCDWKAYGLFGTLGKGVMIVCKNPYVIDSIFMPIAWEKQPEQALATAH